MATIANWNGHTFEVSPKLIRSFEGLTLKGSCETTEKNSGGQKYVERKYGEKKTVSLTVQLNALTGVTDVMGEAQTYTDEAEEGACEYFYVGGRKLVNAKMMLVSAEVQEIVTMPGRGDGWISCSVKLSFEQGSENDRASSGSGSGSGGGGRAKKTRLDVPDPRTGITTALLNNLVATAFSENKKATENGKAASESKRTGLEGHIIPESSGNRQTSQTKDSSRTKDPTTGRESPTVTAALN